MGYAIFKSLYHGSLTKEEATKIMEVQANLGYYMIRHSSRAGYCALSISHTKGKPNEKSRMISHFLIKYATPVESEKQQVLFNSQMFESLADFTANFKIDYDSDNVIVAEQPVAKFFAKAKENIVSSYPPYLNVMKGETVYLYGVVNFSTWKAMNKNEERGIVPIDKFTMEAKSTVLQHFVYPVNFYPSIYKVNHLQNVFINTVFLFSRMMANPPEVAVALAMVRVVADYPEFLLLKGGERVLILANHFNGIDICLAMHNGLLGLAFTANLEIENKKEDFIFAS